MNKVSLAEAGDGSPPFWRRYVAEDFLSLSNQTDSLAHIHKPFTRLEFNRFKFKVEKF